MLEEDRKWKNISRELARLENNEKKIVTFDEEMMQIINDLEVKKNE